MIFVRDMSISMAILLTIFIQVEVNWNNLTQAITLAITIVNRYCKDHAEWRMIKERVISVNL